MQAFSLEKCLVGRSCLENVVSVRALYNLANLLPMFPVYDVIMKVREAKHREECIVLVPI